MYRRYITLCVLLLAGSSAIACSGQRSSELSAIDSFGTWRLSRFGVSKPVELDTTTDTLRRIPFSFMQTAHQGPIGWYIGRLNAYLEFDSNTPINSVAFLNAAVNGANWAQIRVQLIRKNGKIYTRWVCASAIGGSIGKREPGRIARVTFSNYLTIPSVKPGPATISFGVQKYYGAVLKRAVVRVNSGLEYTKLAPAQIELALSGRRVIRKGENAVVIATVKNVGDRYVRNLNVVSEYPIDLLVSTGASNARRRILRARDSFTSELRYRARKPGLAIINIAVVGAGAGDTKDYELKIRKR
jgi:hypothetical protein